MTIQYRTLEPAAVAGRAVMWTLMAAWKEAEELALGAGRTTKLDRCPNVNSRGLEGAFQLVGFCVAAKTCGVTVHPFGDMVQSLVKSRTEFSGDQLNPFVIEDRLAGSFRPNRRAQQCEVRLVL